MFPHQKRPLSRNQEKERAGQAVEKANQQNQATLLQDLIPKAEDVPITDMISMWGQEVAAIIIPAARNSM